MKFFVVVVLGPIFDCLFSCRSMSLVINCVFCSGHGVILDTL